jgi:hypothetical protein
MSEEPAGVIDQAQDESSWRRFSIGQSQSIYMNQLRLCKRSRAFATQDASFSRHWTQSFDLGKGWRDLSRGRKEASPAPDDFFVGPVLSGVRVEVHKYVQVIIEHRESARRIKIKPFPLPPLPHPAG